MIIYRKIEDIAEKLRRPVVTIGNFDGVHLGHRAIFRRVKEVARAFDGVSVVVTFVPHPLQVLRPQVGVRLITCPKQKERLLEASGIDCLVEIPFDQEFAALSAPEFVKQVLVDRIGMEHLVIGYDYAFGRGREGDVKLLQKLGEKYEYSVEVMQPVSDGSTIYSSTAVRNMVAEGDVGGVVSVLGRHYCITGSVVPGHHRGRGLGFPTANLETEMELYPAAGVYAVKAKVDGSVYDGACNIGTNPTFGNDNVTMEVFLFDFEGDLYGREMSVYFVERLRGEKRFSDLEALKDAIAADVRRAKEILGRTRIIEYHDGAEQ
ncbi:bifunctional riboflavin kinase/FAD synthetase [Geomesophilobacter sediminis]|uniref:Riboflavin biosynthesis protein n=1 Tax=Geomesophilobacter sediminis TaxID=2798584 RepID=A0A8J7IWT3_9BACT|nr:bifunctional riboflavin kinase/FAD synthetase [Geomesophilobacter sediminis]MBJ6724097.1 bifunctional riboflavin kinase/FAD synthetase [Geomesophilobacter sediminis]